MMARSQPNCCRIFSRHAIPIEWWTIDIRQLLKTDLVLVGEGTEEESELIQDVIIVGGEVDVSHV